MNDFKEPIVQLHANLTALRARITRENKYVEVPYLHSLLDYLTTYCNATIRAQAAKAPAGEQAANPEQVTSQANLNVMNALGAKQPEDEIEPRDLALEKLDPDGLYSSFDDFVRDFHAQRHALSDVTGTLLPTLADAKWLKRTLTRANDLNTLESDLRALAQEGINAPLHSQNARAVRDAMRELDSECRLLKLKLAEIVDLVGPGGDDTAFGSVESALAEWGEERAVLKAEIKELKAERDEDRAMYDEQRQKLYRQAVEADKEKRTAHETVAKLTDENQKLNSELDKFYRSYSYITGLQFWLDELAKCDMFSLDSKEDRGALAQRLVSAVLLHRK